jgi:stalled ribosome alternative rescue factor ArfA
MRERGEQPSNMWIEELSSITSNHLRRGVSRTVSERLKWPPSLPEFMSLCLDFDTTEAYNRMIARKPVLDDVEYYTRQDCGYRCKRVLDDVKARALFNKIFRDKIELKRKGKLPMRNQKLLPTESAVTEIDKEVSNRKVGMTDIEKRMAKIVANRIK